MKQIDNTITNDLIFNATAIIYQKLYTDYTVLIYTFLKQKLSKL